MFAILSLSSPQDFIIGITAYCTDLKIRNKKIFNPTTPLPSSYMEGLRTPPYQDTVEVLDVSTLSV